jgi:hypothetical protein
MTWFRCVDKTFNFKPQFINKNFSSHLVEDMESRDQGFALSSKDSTFEEEIFFELGGYGMYATKQPKMNFSIHDTGTLRIDCGQISDWIEKIKLAKVREFHDGSKYIKLYSRFSVLVLNEQEKESLMFQMVGKEEVAQAIADEFFDGLTKSWNEMKSAYKDENDKDFPLVSDPEKGPSFLPDKKD